MAGNDEDPMHEYLSHLIRVGTSSALPDEDEQIVEGEHDANQYLNTTGNGDVAAGAQSSSEEEDMPEVYKERHTNNSLFHT